MTNVSAPPTLTPSMVECLGLLARGKTRPEMAAVLFLAPSGVKQRLIRLYRALGVRNATDALAAARRVGILTDEGVTSAEMPTRKKATRCTEAHHAGANDETLAEVQRLTTRVKELEDEHSTGPYVTISQQNGPVSLVGPTRPDDTEPGPTEPDAYIWVHPGRLGGKPCIGGTRLSVDTVTRYVRYVVGGVEAARTAYPYLTRTQVLTACWYQASYGPMPYRRRWAAWAAEHGQAMWSGSFDVVPDPPDEVAVWPSVASPAVEAS